MLIDHNLHKVNTRLNFKKIYQLFPYIPPFLSYSFMLLLCISHLHISNKFNNKTLLILLYALLIFLKILRDGMENIFFFTIK